MKEQKKLTLPRLIIVLLLVALVSTSLLGRTLAKYITSETLADDVVRVAKWGVEITAEGGLFKAVYDSDTAGFDDETVMSVDDVLVVAPGTSGQSAGVSISGEPEVAARIQIRDNGSTLEGWDYSIAENAERVLWTVGVAGNVELTNGSFQDMLDTLTSNPIEVGPNTDLSQDAFNISWSWPFEGNDDADTYYGNKDVAPRIILNLDIDVVQID